jgi:serine/threonine protein kinase
MDDRYEIKGKIGQGGIGAVYRAFDQRMNREVAIKRIVPDKSKGPSDEEDAERQMMKEAGALSALQHPHIVTVYDVGIDEDGPYVVMELLTGKTLDELVQTAPMTGQDFREFCLQTQEALIAAQDLGIVHRDLKPGNVMLTWLPSGKFQVKIVDFGLAKFSPKASLQTLDQSDSIYGSIFFMAPEQFERVPLDSRTDMYAIGCVYYFSLTGKNPYDGDTAPQVMASHLGHLVTPLNELRPDLPRWLCDWVMWHINRAPADRPSDARESLQIFLQNDGAQSQAPAQAAPAQPQRPAPPQRPRLVIPGGTPANAPANPAAVTNAAPMIPPPTQSQALPQPILPPDGSMPSLHTTSVHLTAEAIVSDQDAGPVPVAIAVPEKVPQPAIVATGPISSGGARRPANPVPTQSATRTQGPATQSATRQGQMPPPPKKQKLSTAKIVFIISFTLTSSVIGFFAYKSIQDANKTKAYESLIKLGDEPLTTEIPVDSKQFELLLKNSTTGPLAERRRVNRVLAIAKSTDGTDLDTQLITTAVSPDLATDAREDLMRDVIPRRKNPSFLPSLMTFIRNGKEISSVIAAIDIVTPVVGDSEFAQFLEILRTHPDERVKSAAEKALSGILARSKNKDGMTRTLKEIFSTSVNNDLRSAINRLIGS